MGAPSAEISGATVQALVQSASAALEAAGVSFGHGTACALDEAAWLVLWQLGLPPDSDLTHEPLSEAEQAAVRALIQRRILERKPAAYLTRQAWLQGVEFHVDERCIVPRSLIAEVLAEGSADAWLSDRTRTVLDLCCGGASLACLAAMAWPEVQVTASDISPDALAVARLNIRRHGLETRVHLVQADGLTAVPGGPWDLIVCNPPYVPDASMQQLPAEYRAEPALALAGGADGMDFVRRLMRELPAHLAADGVLVLEIGHERRAFEAAFPRLAVHWLPTSAGEDQVLLLPREGLECS